MIENMPTPIDHIDHMRPRKTLHGRAPKDQRVGLYRRLYEAAGLDRAMATRLEGAMAYAMYRGIDEQHALTLRWIRDEIDFPEFVDEYERWFGRHLGRTSKVTADALAGERWRS